MDGSLATAILMVLAVAGANWPFLTRRWGLLGPRRGPKPLALELLELLVVAGLLVIAGRLLEGRIGQVHAQGWAFYAVVLCLMLTLAFPGFVWRHLRRGA